MSYDKEKYQAAIPKCCRFHTAQEHLDYYGLCWGILSAIADGVPMECWGCDEATRKMEAPE